MIPKVIHYCWFGQNQKGSLIKTCIDSWFRQLPDYKVVEWNETNFDVSVCHYVQQAYERKRWAFVSDYARLWALYNFGGIYLDTDVEVLKSFDCFLDNEAFTGYESSDCPVTAVLGSEKGNELVGKLLHEYDSRCFYDEFGREDLTTNTVAITEYLTRNGLKPNGRKQTIEGFTIYPQVYFCPNNIGRIWDCVSKNSYAIHHFDQSWRDEKREIVSLRSRVRRYLVGVLRNTMGTKRVQSLKKR